MTQISVVLSKILQIKQSLDVHLLIMFPHFEALGKISECGQVADSTHTCKYLSSVPLP